MRRAIVLTAALAFAAPASATVLYSTSFEAPGFSLGPLDGQNGWQVSSLTTGYDDSQNVVVQNAVTNDGGQAVALPTRGVGAAADVAVYYAYGPITPSGPITVSMAMNIGDVAGTPETFGVSTSPGTDAVTAGVSITSAGGELQFAAVSSGFPVLGGRAVSAGTWFDLSMTLDYATQTYSVSIGGQQLAAGLAFCGGWPDSSDCSGDAVTQFGDVEFIRRPVKAVTESYFDDVTISEAPEPATWALTLAGFAGVAAVLRARRRAREARALSVPR